MRFVRSAFAWGICCVAFGAVATGQTYRHAGTEFETLRRVVLPEGASVAVADFHHQGQLNDEGTNVLVLTVDRKPVATRVLQSGPGDLCRVAFETAPRQREYLLFYGGEPPRSGEVPPWTNEAGLVLETREYRQCNLNSFESVKQAFEDSTRIGSDYVETVQQASNPFVLMPAPFLSRYRGTLRIETPGKYGFFTSSQDCSFLLIDDQLVASAPGRHGPTRRARPETRHEIELSPGPHKFEYYHAASGPRAMMAAAWEKPPLAKKPKPIEISSADFRADAIGRALVGPPETRQERLLPHFSPKITGSVPLPDNPEHLVEVAFENLSPPALLTKSRMRWDFGDGQTSDQPEPAHVFLRPGLYPVTLSIQRGVTRVGTTYVVEVAEPGQRTKDPHEIDRYLPILETYDAAKLDAPSLQQLVAAYLWKAELTVTPKQNDQETRSDGQDGETEATTEDLAKTARQLKEREADAREYLARAVEVARVGFVEESAAKGDEALFELARVIGPVARDRLGNSRLAGQIWLAASRRISRPEFVADCQLQAADIALNDMVSPQGARPLLDRATAAVGQAQTGDMPSQLRRVWGDYYAATGEGALAKSNYLDAEALLTTDRSHVEQIAWRGAHSRSTEQFLKSGRFDRAAEQLHEWQKEFPSAKIGGYMHLLFARYWSGRGNHAAAIAQSQQIQTINPTSPYADRLLAVAAECEQKRGQVDRALACLHAILDDYPGSPLVPQVQQEIEELKREQQE